MSNDLLNTPEVKDPDIEEKERDTVMPETPSTDEVVETATVENTESAENKIPDEII